MIIFDSHINLLGEERPRADPGGVGFDDAVDITNPSRRNSETSQDATNRTVARRYKTASNTDISI